MTGEPQDSAGNFGQIRVTGKSPQLWQQMRPKLLQAVGHLLDDVASEKGESYFKERAKNLGRSLFDFAQAHLEKPSAENEKILSEAAANFALAKERLATARLQHAQAGALEFETALKKLRTCLITSKAFLVGDESEEAIVFGQQVDALLEAVQSVTEGEPA